MSSTVGRGPGYPDPNALTASDLAQIAPKAWSKIAEHHTMVIRIAHNINLAVKAGVRVDEAYIAGIMKKCADHGINVIQWAPRYIGTAIYRSQVVAPFTGKSWFDGTASVPITDAHKAYAQAIVNTLKHFDPYDFAVRQAGERNMKFIAQVSLFDYWSPVAPDPFYEQHKDSLLLNRNYERYFPGLPCYVEKDPQDYLLAEIRELLQRGADGIAVDMTSHQAHYWPIDWGKPEADSFGFNPALVEEFERRYGVNVRKQKFDLERWRMLQGEVITRFLRRIKTVLKDKPLVVGITPSGYVGYGGYPGRGTSPEFGKGAPAYVARLEWQKWLRDEVVDAVMVYTRPEDTVESVEAMKAETKTGRVQFWMEPLSANNVEDYRSKLKQVHTGALDGFAVHEEAYFEAEGFSSLWDMFNFE